jgi:hypothetical protein
MMFDKDLEELPIEEDFQ